MRKKNQKTIGLYLLPALPHGNRNIVLSNIYQSVRKFLHLGAMSSKHEFVGIANYLKMFEDKGILCGFEEQPDLYRNVGDMPDRDLIGHRQRFRSKVYEKGAELFRSVYFIPSLLMVTVVGITFKMIYSPSIGLINPLLELAGIDTSNIDLLGNAGSATYAIAAMSQWQYIGYTVILFIVAIQNIPEDLYEAADIDGANAIKKFSLSRCRRSRTRY